MGRVLLPEQLLRAVLPGRAEGAVPGAVQLREALLLPILLHIPFHLSTHTSLSMRMPSERQEFRLCPSLLLFRDSTLTCSQRVLCQFDFSQCVPRTRGDMSSHALRKTEDRPCVEEVR